MNPYLILAALVAIAGAYLKGRSDGDELAEARDAREREIAAVAYANGQRGAAKVIAGLQVTHTTIQGRVEREIREKTVYRDCRHSDDGLQLVNAALTGRAEPAGGGELPGADTSR